MVFLVKPGLQEGSYTSWTYKWTNSFTNGLYSTYYLTAYIDDEKGILYISWRDSAGFRRFGVYNIADFSAVFESAAGSNYKSYGIAGEKYAMRGEVTEMGIAVALRTYVLICRYDREMLEVWQGGATPLWFRDISGDNAGAYVRTIQISLTGRYILVYTNSSELMLYEGG